MKTTYYTSTIEGITDKYPANLIEAQMRLAHSTLDQLSKSVFKKEVLIAVDVIAYIGIKEAEKLAKSYNL